MSLIGFGAALIASKLGAAGATTLGVTGVGAKIIQKVCSKGAKYGVDKLIGSDSNKRKK